MSRNAKSGHKGRLAVGVTAAALVLGLPSASFAVNLLEDGASFASLESFASFTPASVDPRLAQMIETRNGGKARMMRFTPAGISENNNRALTVAVRVNDESVQAVTVRSVINATREPVALDAQTRVASTRYNLGLARGYRSFAQAPALSQPLTNAAIPDLADFEPSPGVQDQPSRFGARIAFEEDLPAQSTASATRDALHDQSLDVAGSYRLTRNLDVTAGVRYQQERDVISALPDIEQQDSQAVYIGTQFRF